MSGTAKKEPKKYVIIHAHFYQPPREDPWTEEVPLQSSAAPYHDWNERINAECYTPNALARVISSDGGIISFVNNYQFLNFNFGPTLFSWLEHHSQRTYYRIIKAADESVKATGHSNAFAQVYNHIIMPLADQRDRLTQIRWAVTEYHRRFGIDPEGLWLSETAINSETVTDLINEGIKYIILSPFQAEAYRHITGGEWTYAENGDIDPKEPYRIFEYKGGKPDRLRYLDVLFYDAPISSAVSFEGLLHDAQGFAARIDSAFDPNREADQVVAIGTDGEAYGHHKKFGDMCLASYFKFKKDIFKHTVTNAAWYMAEHKPMKEVRLKAGRDNRGTAWSCAHGVERWRSDCGCNTGAQPGWNQKWRTPLREAYDMLRDELRKIYIEQTEGLFADPWKARDEYIDIILNRTGDEISEFILRNCEREVSDEERIKLLSLMESQRNAMLMYTSCAWFFADISGIETVQTMKYAAWAIHLVQPYTSLNLHEMLSEKLAEAKSNIKKFKDGKWLYNHWVRPYILTPESIAAKVALRSTVDIIESEFTRGIYTARVWDLKTINCEEYSYKKGIVDIHNELTGKKDTAAFWVFYHEPLASLAYVLPADGHEYPDVDNKLKNYNIADCEISLQRVPAIQIFSLPELDYTDRQEIITGYFEGTLQSIYSDYHDYWRRHEDTLRRIGSYDMTLPQTVRDALRSLFEIELINSLKDGARTLSSQTIARAVELKDMIVANKLAFNKTVVTEYISELIDRTVGEIYSNWQRFNWELLDMTVDIIRDLELEPKLCYLQEAILRLLELQLVHRIDNLIGEMQFADKETLKAREQLIKTEYHLCSVIVFIASNIGIHTEQYRLQLRLVEKFIGDTFFSDDDG